MMAVSSAQVSWPLPINTDIFSDSLPSHESPSESLGATDGVGALPGSKFESGVAKLPAERSPLGGDDISKHRWL